MQLDTLCSLFLSNPNHNPIRHGRGIQNMAREKAFKAPFAHPKVPPKSGGFGLFVCLWKVLILIFTSFSRSEKCDFILCSVADPPKSTGNDEYLAQYQCDDGGDKEKPRRSKERDLISKENVLYGKETSEPDNRGEIVVIGATNRLDSIDPALRRPGRFGREFLFNLPNKEARKEIFKIHTRDWTPKPPDMLLDELAEKCIGYCGADIKSLCTEAALCSLRRCYPQIYASREKLLLDVNSIKIKAKDFFMALKKVVPASNRIVASPGQALSPIFKPLFKRSGANILQVVQKIFPHAQLALKEDRQQDHLNPILQDDMFDSDDNASLVSGDELKDGMPDRPEKKRLCFSRSAFCEPTSRRPRLLIVGKEGYGQVSYVAPAVLHTLEKFPVHTLDLSVLLTNVAPPEEICGQVPFFFLFSSDSLTVCKGSIELQVR
eukprot:XP_027303210.1 ATPase family AAA domain-containing protein 2-like [Anas platyrhynchos]